MTSNGLSSVPEGADELDSSLHFELDDLEGTGLVNGVQKKKVGRGVSQITAVPSAALAAAVVVQGSSDCQASFCTL